jgi:uncharacterized membrane protein
VKLAAIGLALMLAAAPAWAQRSLAIKHFDAAIVVHQDGTVDVTETITAEFTGKWNGIYRTVPVKYHTPQGFSWTLRLEGAGATNAEGTPLKLESARERHYIKYKLWVPGAEDATRTVVFHYRALNGLRFFEDHDELYWNLTGDEWDVPIEAVTARIELPLTVSGVRAIAFNGAYGSTAQDAEVAVQGNTVLISMPKALGFHEGVTGVVGWDKGTVVEPTATDKAASFLASNWPLAIPIPVFLGMFLLWRRVGRDPEKRPVTAQYEPPAGLTPAEAGTLLDESVDMRDITATVVDLAVGGRLRIEEKEESRLFGLISDTEYIFHRVEPKEGARALEPHEQEVFDGIFRDTTKPVRLSDLDDEFYACLPGIRAGVYSRLVGRGLYRSRPDQVKARWIGGGLVLGAILTLVGTAIGANLNLTPLPIVVGGLLSAVIVALFGRIMPARTVAGARAYEGTRGFEEFLRRVESDRFARVVKTPEMFERFLPYAMAFGVEKKWANAFQDIVREPPNWYVGGHAIGFNASGFTSRIADLSTRAGSSMSSSPRSSGGSGFSGGGSSGGGGGGGGGGGF